MSALAERSAMSLAKAARIMADAMKDKSYLDLPMGREVGRYLRAKRKELTASSYVGYESTLHKLALQFAYLELKDLEVPIGSERIEEWMDERWGDHAPGTYNVIHSHLSDFFRWQVRHRSMRSNPMELVGRARKRDVHRTTFTKDQRRAIIAAASDRRDRLALRLLLDYGIRKGSLRAVQFKHFDYQRRQLTVFSKGGKVRQMPIPHAEFWTDLERHVLDVEAQPDHYLMYVTRWIPVGAPDSDGRRRQKQYRYPERGMSSTPMHHWWYDRLKHAGIVGEGVSAGERMHKARHTAGQRVLDRTGDLKLVQRLLGHASIQTTGDVYVDYDIDQWASKLAEALKEDEESA